MPSGTWDQLLAVTTSKLAAPGGPERKKLGLDMLVPNPNQPRQFFDDQALAELASSIGVHGVLQPLLVRPHPLEKGRFEIVAGERRYQAARRAGVSELPVVVRELSDSETLELALVENLMREDITPIEEARSLQSLLDAFGYSYAQLGERLGKNKAYVDHRVRLLKMPAEIQAALERTARDAGEGKMRRPFTPRHANAIAQVAEPVLRERLIEAVFAEHLTVAETLRRKDGLQAVAEAAVAATTRAQLEAAVIDGLDEAELQKRLTSARPSTTKQAETVRVRPDALAVTGLLIAALESGDMLPAETLLAALRADERKLRALLAR